jgi:hypothetical protein
MDVLEIAKIIPPRLNKSPQIEELNYLFSQFPEKEKEDLLTYMRIKLMMNINR